MIKKLFISQPMNGLSNEEIEAARKEILATVQKKMDEHEIGCEVVLIDSFFKDAPHDAQPLWFLGKSFELLSTADIVYFGKGWKNARGCKMEEKAANEYLLEKNVLIMYAD